MPNDRLPPEVTEAPAPEQSEKMGKRKKEMPRFTKPTVVEEPKVEEPTIKLEEGGGVMKELIAQGFEPAVMPEPAPTEEVQIVTRPYSPVPEKPARPERVMSAKTRAEVEAGKRLLGRYAR